MSGKTWNNGAVTRFFRRHAETGTHVVASGSLPVEPYGAGYRVDVYLMDGPFDPSGDHDLSKRAKRSIAQAEAAFITIERWVDEAYVTYFLTHEGGLAEATLYYEGFLNLMEAA